MTSPLGMADAIPGMVLDSVKRGRVHIDVYLWERMAQVARPQDWADVWHEGGLASLLSSCENHGIKRLDALKLIVVLRPEDEIERTE